jgi:hypothetical protein
MKIWNYAVNSYYKTASIYVDIIPRHLVYFERVVEYFCCIRILHWIKFPNWNFICVDDDGHWHWKADETTYTLKEWWGDLGSWFHCTIHTPIFQYVYDYKRYKTFSYPADYDKLKADFKDIDKEYWDRIAESEKEDEKMREEDERLL